MSAPRLDLQIRRAYDPPSPDDGTRILIDRLWPRGLRKDGAQIDHWLKDLAPSPALRVWFGHAPQRFAEFSSRYTAELDAMPADAAALQTLSHALRAGRVTLLFAAHDPQINHARVLEDWLRRPHAWLSAKQDT
ncbi:MAG: DUF488 family protein [Thiomonas sp.]|uniref:DUF488 domain-containing protein n=1 Tax=Thiomonas sp. TaxID=2047785 RepID=UPI002A36E205|nr:DUF488 family protein [Thiomonas sp.]MDY0330296.1 DUF488 family protein [Thiomonas sp.]